MCRCCTQAHHRSGTDSHARIISRAEDSPEILVTDDSATSDSGLLAPPPPMNPNTRYCSATSDTGLLPLLSPLMNTNARYHSAASDNGLSSISHNKPQH